MTTFIFEPKPEIFVSKDGLFPEILTPMPEGYELKKDDAANLGKTCSPGKCAIGICTSDFELYGNYKTSIYKLGNFIKLTIKEKIEKVISTEKVADLVAVKEPIEIPKGSEIKFGEYKDIVSVQVQFDCTHCPVSNCPSGKYDLYESGKCITEDRGDVCRIKEYVAGSPLVKDKEKYVIVSWQFKKEEKITREKLIEFWNQVRSGISQFVAAVEWDNEK